MPAIDSGEIEIVVAAKDAATTTIGNISSSLGVLSQASAKAAQSALTLGQSIGQAFSGSIALTSQVAQAVSAIVSIFTTPIGEGNLFTEIIAVGEEAATQTQKLSTLLHAFGEISGSALIGSTQNFISFGKTAVGITDSVNSALVRVFTIIKKIPNEINTAGNAIAGVAGFFGGIKNPVDIFEDLRGAVGNVSGIVNEASQQIFFFTSAIESLQSIVATGPYRLLIQQNVELRQQLLQTQASLVATNKIVRDGVGISDPTTAITALDAPVKAAIDRIRRDSLELVGVTSSQLVDVFNTIVTRSAQVGLNIREAGDLTIDFSAALGTIGLPMHQASQEISTILTGTIDQNSVLAKTLGLQNEQVKRLSRQGKLYDFLKEKLQAFRAGNALASQTIEGVGSNILEIIELVGLSAGEPLLKPLVEELNRFYGFLSSNQGLLTDYVGEIVDDILRVGLSVSDIFKSVASGSGDFLKQIPLFLFNELANGAEALSRAISATFQTLKPFINLLARLSEFAGTNWGFVLVQIAIQAKVLTTVVSVGSSALSRILSLIPGVGESIFLVSQQLLPAIKQFGTLSSTLNSSSAAMLLLGKNINSIPGALDIVSDKIPVFGKLFAPYIPQISSFGIALAGFSNQIPGFGKGLEQITQLAGKEVFPNIAGQLRKAGLSEFATLLDDLSDKTVQYGTKTGLLNAAQSQFADISTNIRKTLIKKAIAYGALGAAAGAALIVLSEVLQRSKDAGDGIRSITADLEAGAERTRSAWTQTLKEIDDGTQSLQPPALDWVDRVILMNEAIGKGEAKIRGVGDALLVVGAIVGEVVFTIAKLFQNLGEAIGESLFFGIELLKNAAGAVKAALTFDFDSFKSSMAGVFGSIANLVKASTKAILGTVYGIVQPIVQAIARIVPGGKENLEKLETAFAEAFDTEVVTQNLGDIETKAEEKLREISEAIDSGQLQAAMADQVGAIDELIESQKPGEIFNDSLAPVRDAIASLRSGTGDVEDVKAAIASLPDAIPDNRRDDLVNMLAREFPNGANEASASVRDLADALSGVEDAGKLSDLKLALSGLSDGSSDLEAVKSALSDLEGTIPQDQFDRLNVALGDNRDTLGESYDAANNLANSFTALDKTLGIVSADASNIFLDEQSKQINDNISALEDQLRALEDSGQGYSSNARELRSLIGQLEEARDRFSEFTSAVDVVANPIEVAERELANYQEELGRLNNALTTNREATRAQLAQQRNRGEISQGFFDTESLRLEREAMETELEATRIRLKKAYDSYNALNEEEKAKASGLVEQINQFSQKASGLEINLVGKEREARAALKEQRLEDYDEQVSLVKAQAALGKVSNAEAAKRTSELQKARSDAEIAQLQSSLSKLSETDKEGREKINAQIAELQATQVEQQRQAFADRVSILKKASDEEVAIVESRASQGLIPQQEAIARTRELQVNANNAQIAALQEHLATVGENEVERRREITAEIAGLQAERTELIRSSYQQQLEAVQKTAEDEAAIIESRASQGLIPQQEAIARSRELRVSANDAQIAILQEHLSQLTDLEVEKRREITAQIAGLQAERTELIRSSYQQQLEAIQKAAEDEATILESNANRGLIPQKGAIEQAKTLRLEANKAQVAVLQEHLSQLTDLEVEKRREITAQIAGLMEERGAILEEALNRELELTREKSAAQLAALDASGATDARSISQRAQIQSRAGKEEISALRQHMGQLEATDTAGRQRILTQIEEIKAQELEIEANARSSELSLMQQGASTRQSALDLSLAQRNASSAESAQLRASETQRANQEEISLLRSHLRELAGTDKEGRDRIKAQISQLETEQVEAAKAAREAAKAEREAVLGGRLDRGLDAIAQAATQQQIQLQSLFNAGAIAREEMDVQMQASTIARITAEIAAERERLKLLESQPSSSDPETERQRQSQIRDARQKTLDLTLQGLEAQKSAQETLIGLANKEISRRAEAARNLATVAVQDIEAQTRALEAQTGALQRQEQILAMRGELLAAQQELFSAKTDLATGELDALSTLERSAFKRRKLERVVAGIKLQSAIAQIQFEEKSLILQQEQEAIALNRQKIENEIAQAKQQAAIAQARADIAEINAQVQSAALDPDLTPEKRAALELQRQAAVEALNAQRQALGALQKESGLLDRQSAQQREIFGMQRELQENRSRGQIRQAEVGFVQSLSPGDRRRASEALQKQIVEGLGFDSERDLLASGQVGVSQQLQELGVDPTRRQQRALPDADPLNLESLVEVPDITPVREGLVQASTVFGDNIKTSSQTFSEAIDTGVNQLAQVEQYRYELTQQGAQNFSALTTHGGQSFNSMAIHGGQTFAQIVAQAAQSFGSEAQTLGSSGEGSNATVDDLFAQLNDGLAVDLKEFVAAGATESQLEGLFNQLENGLIGANRTIDENGARQLTFGDRSIFSSIGRGLTQQDYERTREGVLESARERDIAPPPTPQVAAPSVTAPPVLPLQGISIPGIDRLNQQLGQAVAASTTSTQNIAPNFTITINAPTNEAGRQIQRETEPKLKEVIGAMRRIAN